MWRSPSEEYEMTGSTEDERLVHLAVNGDVSAFQQLYDRHKGRVFARLTKLIGASPDREDLLQQVFWLLHRALPTFRGASSLGTFLYRITSNVTCDYLRKQSRRRGSCDDEALKGLIDTLPTPEEWSHARHQLEVLFTAMAQLKPHRRMAFVLVVIEGLSVDDAAEQLDARASVIRQRVALARADLLAFVERERRSEARLTWRLA
jgi:RNA polymerase sigma-70 factor, ECF subfamily